MKKIINILALTLFSVSMVFGQTATDALRYSYHNLQGTARGTAVGSAMGGLGGDFTAVSINPAGIGGFWKSEFMFTPAFINVNTKSSLNDGPASEEITNKFNFSNLGVVFANQTKRSSTWKSVGLGLGMNRLNNFHQNFFFEGESIGSIVDRFAGLAFNLHPDDLDPFEAGPAYETGAIYDFEGDFIYETDLIQSGETPFTKRQLSNTSGYHNEMSISFGGNYKDKLLVGGAIGIPFLSYQSERRYRESDDADAIQAFNRLAFNENLSTDGAGFNVKIGVIAKINQNLRLGAAFHSPTFLTLNDRYDTEMEYSYTTGGTSEMFTSNSPVGEFEYGLTTPWKAVGNAAYIFGKNGFLTADVEYVDYASARFNFTRNSENIDDEIYETQVNNSISDSYRGNVNIRLGGELAMEGLRFRGGVQLLGSPIVDDNTIQKLFSVGAGIRGNKSFIDLAYQFSNQKEGYLPYEVEGAPNQLVTNRINRGQILMTIGFKI